MAVIAPSRRSLILLACAAIYARADDSADVHQVIGDVSEALSSGDAAQAISFFSKSCPDYDKLSADFAALCGAYSIQNQIGFSDEEVQASIATVAISWAITLTPLQSTSSKNRNADITLKLKREGKHWRITALDPITIFDPSRDG